MRNGHIDTRRPVDKVMIAAMKKADRIVFRHTPEKGSQIEAIKEAKPTKADPFAREVMVVIPCSFGLDDYGSEGSDEYPAQARAFDLNALDNGIFYGFEMEHNAQSARAWQTIVASLKDGDMIGLRWMRNAGTSPALVKLGVVVDELRLWVERGERCAGTYNVDHRAVPMANAESHRMVRTNRF